MLIAQGLTKGRNSCILNGSGLSTMEKWPVVVMIGIIFEAEHSSLKRGWHMNGF